MRDAFLSYAGEDKDIATQVFNGLSKRGFDVWYAPRNLRVGQKLLDAVERGMQESRFGILLLSQAYLSKGWTAYEMDILLRSFIEDGKPLLPIWMNVDKQDVAKFHSGLAGIIALRIDSDIDDVSRKLAVELSGQASTIGVVPLWESPAHRFLQGRGEILIGSTDGVATSLWEFLLHAADSQYPLFLAGDKFSKEELLWRAAELLGQVPEVAKQWVQDAGFHRVWAMCESAGIDPRQFQ